MDWINNKRMNDNLKFVTELCEIKTAEDVLELDDLKARHIIDQIVMYSGTSAMRLHEL